MRTIILFFLILSGFRSNSQLSIRPFIDYKKSYHPNINEPGYKYYPTDIYQGYGIQSSFNIRDRMNVYIGFQSEKYKTPAALDRFTTFRGCFCEVSINSTVYSIGLNINHNKWLYYIVGSSMNELSNLEYLFDEDNDIRVDYSLKPRGNEVSLYNIEIGLGVTKYNFFTELRYSNSLYVDGVESDSFKGTKSINLHFGYNFRIL